MKATGNNSNVFMGAVPEGVHDEMTIRKPAGGGDASAGVDLHCGWRPAPGA